MVYQRINEVLGARSADGEAFDEYAVRILDATERELLDHGLQRTSMARIATAAGVARKTLFNRFGSRDGLLGAVVGRELRQFIADVDAAIPRDGEPEERVVAAIVAAGRGLARQRLLRRLLVTDPDLVLPLLTTEFETGFAVGRDYVAEQIARARADGMAISGDPEMLAELFVRIAHSMLLLPSSVLPLDDDERMAELARAHMLPLLRGPGTPTQED